MQFYLTSKQTAAYMKKSPKQIAIEMLSCDLPCLFDYYYERDHDDYDKANEKTQEEIGRHIRKFEDRFHKMLMKARGKK